MKYVPKKHDLVCMNNTPTAAVFKIVDVDNSSLGVVDATIDPANNPRIHWMDASLVYPATKAQLKNAALPER